MLVSVLFVQYVVARIWKVNAFDVSRTENRSFLGSLMGGIHILQKPQKHQKPQFY